MITIWAASNYACFLMGAFIWNFPDFLIIRCPGVTYQTKIVNVLIHLLWSLIISLFNVMHYLIIISKILTLSARGPSLYVNVLIQSPHWKNYSISTLCSPWFIYINIYRVVTVKGLQTTNIFKLMHMFLRPLSESEIRLGDGTPYPAIS